MSLEEATETDVVTDVNGVKFVVDKSLDKRFGAVRVDYGTKMFRKGFMISLESDDGGGCH